MADEQTKQAGDEQDTRPAPTGGDEARRPSPTPRARTAEQTPDPEPEPVAGVPVVMTTEAFHRFVVAGYTITDQGTEVAAGDVETVRAAAARAGRELSETPAQA